MKTGLIEPPESGLAGIRFVTSTRCYGGSSAASKDNSMAFHTGDDPVVVERNRRRLAEQTGCGQIQWLNQVHGTTCVQAMMKTAARRVPEADACWTRQVGLGLAVLTADCLPVVLWDAENRQIGVAHAGWRGLLGGVLEALTDRFESASLQAWIGPAIGVKAYEVGEDVYTQVAGLRWRMPFCLPAPDKARKWQLNLAGLAREILNRAGVREVTDSGLCTYEDERFYSYRRDAATGRMVTLVWMSASADRPRS